MIGPEPLCMRCKHLHENRPWEWGFRYNAFPKGISDDIFYEEFDHRPPYDGDRGIQFEPKVCL